MAKPQGRVWLMVSSKCIYYLPCAKCRAKCCAWLFSPVFTTPLRQQKSMISLPKATSVAERSILPTATQPVSGGAGIWIRTQPLQLQGEKRKENWQQPIPNRFGSHGQNLHSAWRRGSFLAQFPPGSSAWVKLYVSIMIELLQHLEIYLLHWVAWA